MGDVVNLRRFRKDKAREDADKQAQANRQRFGRTKAATKLASVEQDAARRHIDGHKRERPDESGRDS